MNHEFDIALVTGATSGLGLEAAAQLAEEGTGRVIITGRTESRARTARDTLITRTKRNIFETLELDLDSIASAEAAADALRERGVKIDLLILNAGIAPPGTLSMSADDIERTVSSSLVGHHVLTARLLEYDLLSENAHIVIASSEAARGDVPTFNPVDLHQIADVYFDGDYAAAVEAQLRMKSPAKYKTGDVYATAKVLVAWWTAELARRLPAGMSVVAVSPGPTPDTNAIRNAPFYMRRLMLPMFRLVPGMSHSVGEGARRYLDVAGMDDEASGRFFASPPRKLTGPLQQVELPHIDDRAAQEAGWAATARVSGVDIPARRVEGELATLVQSA